MLIHYTVSAMTIAVMRMNTQRRMALENERVFALFP